jgi:hypothetical protein
MDQEKQEQQDNPGTGLVQLEMKRNEDYTTLYANHLYLEPTFWDLKIYFAELDRMAVPGHIVAEVHTGMNISWSLAKVLSYLLQVHITAHEFENGKIKLPSNALPELPPQPPTDDPKAIEVHRIFKGLRDRFIADAT